MLFTVRLSLSLPLFSLAGYVEALAYRLGMQIPDLSPKQADMWQTRVSSHAVSSLAFYCVCVKDRQRAYRTNKHST